MKPNKLEIGSGGSLILGKRGQLGSRFAGTGAQLSGVGSDVYNMAERIREFDPDLDLTIDYITNEWVIARYHEPTGEFFAVRRFPQGTVLDDRIIKDLDMMRRLGEDGELGWENLQRRAEADKAAEEKDWDAELQERHKDMIRHLALKGAIHAPRVSMHVSKKEKKEASE